MPAAASSGTRVYAFLTFHVRTSKIAGFCEAAAELLAASQGDKGRVRIAIHQELPWARSISNEEFKLFMMEQTWATGADLEAHIGSAHAMGFNAAMLKHRMLVTEPSVSIFGEPLTAEQLRALAQAGMALAQRAAESVSPTEGALALRCMGPLRLSDGSAVRWLRSLRTAPGFAPARPFASI